MDVETASTRPPAATAAPLSPTEVRTIIVGVLLAMFLAALDQTIVATALPSIGRDLGDLQDMPWVVTAYLVGATAVTPLYGKFSDIHGRRITMLIGITTFIVGSVACALAPSMLALIVARAIQGLGGGGLISLAQTVVADVTAPRERGRYQVYFAVVFATASLSGPLLGGLLAEYLHWSVIFWINLPLGLLAFWMANAALKRLPRYERRHRLDVLGAALIVAATTTLLMALSWGGIRFPWASAEMAGLLLASLLFWVLFTIRLLTAGEPLVPLSVLANNVVRTGTTSACFGMGTLIALTIFMPVYFEAVTGLTASQSGLALIPLTIGTVIGAQVASRVMLRNVRYKHVPLAGLLIAMVATLVLAAFAHRMPLPAMLAVLSTISLGFGTLLPVTTVAVQNAVPHHQLGTTTATSNFFRQIGGALMVAIFGAIVLSGIAEPGVSFETFRGATGDAAELTNSFRWMFFAAFLGFALSFVLLLMMEERPLRTSATPDQKANPAE